jgi:hypothetical protein
MRSARVKLRVAVIQLNRFPGQFGLPQMPLPKQLLTTSLGRAIHHDEPEGASRLLALSIAGLCMGALLRRIKGGKTPPRRFRCQAPSFIGSAAPGHSPCAVNYLRVLARARLPTLSSTDALGKVQRLPNSGAGGGVGLAGLEPATSVLSGLRSHHLS